MRTLIAVVCLFLVIGLGYFAVWQAASAERNSVPVASDLPQQIDELEAEVERLRASFRREFGREFPDALLTIQVHDDAHPQPLRIYGLNPYNRDATFGVVTNVLSLDAMEVGRDSAAWWGKDADATNHVGSFSCRFIRNYYHSDIYYFRF